MKMVRTAGVVLLLVLVFLAFTPSAHAQTLDQYGGYTFLPVPGGATGHFRVAKLGDRWVFATPSGNAFWMVGVFNIDVDDRFLSLATKYGTANPRAQWGIQATRRLSKWGFNAVGEYASGYVMPGQLGVTQMPALVMVRPTVAGLAAGVFKDLIEAVATTYTGPARSFPDVFDPAFASHVNTYTPAVVADPFWLGLATSPWCIGITMDDADDLFGFGPGPELISARVHPHDAWFALAASPTKASSTRWGKTYTDTKVYTKYQLRSFLQTRYGSIDLLNVAWGSNYTTWDSAGGWPAGTGWLDEDGRHTAWLGSTDGTLTGATVTVVKDLDDFLYQIADKYFSTVAGAARAAAANKLVWGPASLNGWGGLTRKPILQAAGVWLDVLNAQVSSQAVLDRTAAYFGDKPVVSWEGYTANPDSALYAYPDSPPGDSVAYQYTFPDQAARGDNYGGRMSFLLNSAVTATGSHTITGLKFWAWSDSWGEKRNWGLVSLRDNAYDGKEAVIAAGTDPWGYPIGGEDNNYGDFLGAVTRANAGIPATLGTGGSTTINFTSPSDGATVQQSVTVSASAIGAVSQVGLALDGTLVAVTPGSANTYVWNTTTVPNGTHSWRATAYDAAGNPLATSSIKTLVNNPDSTLPAVQITQPSSGTVRRRSTMTIAADASDNVGVVRVEFYVNGVRVCTDTAAPYTCSWKVPSAVNKSYILQAKAYDAIGNVGVSPTVGLIAQ